MPGMFSRRRGSSAQPPANRSTMNAAAAAASQAFVNQSSSQQGATLSSAAAAAALRSHTTTPEPVGSLQTKRMMRRGSVSSVLSGNGALNTNTGRSGSMNRSSSIGSMTERTFRTTSPSPSRANGARTPLVTAPPVPAMPKTLRSGPPRRSSSTEPPERVLSPTPGANRRSASVDKTNLAASSTAKSTLPKIAEGEIRSRPPSVNFSRPRIGSPEPGPVRPSINIAAANAKTTSSSEVEYVMVFDPNSRTFVKQARPKQAPIPEPSSPIIDTAPKLKPGDYDPATRSIIPLPQPPRPTSLLHKQPSVVREDPDAEREAEAATPSKPAPRPATKTSQDSSVPSKSYAPASSHQRTVSLDVPRADGSRGRGGSLSPSRSARFSAQPILDSTVHEPHRGVSPAKSAMKHSPSSSIRTASPVATFSPAVLAHSAASDVSDTTSLTSADGSSGKKRRSVRVSIEDGAPVPPVPAVKPVTRPARTTEIVSDDDQDDIMKPRPELPSFGSVRRNKMQSDIAEKVSETSPERATSVSEEPSKAVSEPPQTASGPIPTPEAVNKNITPVVEEKTEAVPAKKTEVVPAKKPEAVPSINLQPPPSTVEEDKTSTDDEVGRMSESQEIQNLASGLIFYGDESDDSRSRRLSEDHTAPVITRKDSDADQYTDAPESQDGPQQGFASLDAIVESPLASPVKDKAVSPDETAESKKEADWTAASARWSAISKQQKEQHDRGEVVSDEDSKTKRSFFKRNKKSKDAASASPPLAALDTAPVVTAPESPLPSPVKKSVPSLTSQPLKPALKKPAPTKDTSHHLLRSMRDSDEPIQQKQRPASALVADAPRATKAVRPMSTQVESFNSSTSKQARQPAPIRASSHTASKMVKKFQDDSDSESSFKKKRKAASSVNGQGKYNMKRSMREGSVDSSQRVSSPTPNGRGRGGSFLRPMSPSSVTSGRESLRSTMRSGQSDSRSLRSQQKSAGPSISSSMASRFKSRFVDSDDEDDAPAPRQYRSRFVDSDDEDDYTIPEELTPVRGIPRRKGQEDGDSTDLEGESDGERAGSKKKRDVKAINPSEAEIEKAMDAARRKLGIAAPGSAQPQPTEGNALQQGSLRDRRDRDNDKVLLPDFMSDIGSNVDSQGRRKKGFMIGLLKRNKPSSQSTMTTQTESAMVTSPHKVTSPDDTPSSPASAKMVRRISNQPPPRLSRGFSNFSTATAPAAHGRRRDEDWPLPPPIPTDHISALKLRNGDRPQTSDEALVSTKPDNRRSFSARVGFTDDAIAHSERGESEAGGSDVVFSKRTGRKKRFGMLRKAFGLYD